MSALNSDVIIQGTNYHVQSEDWGAQNPFLVTRVFKNGALIKSVKTSYAEVLFPSSFRDRAAVLRVLEDQHKRIINYLEEGLLRLGPASKL